MSTTPPPAIISSNDGKLVKNTREPFILALKMGENLFESILRCAREAELKSASISGKDTLKKQFIEENYENYKELCDYDVFALIKQLSQMCDSHPAVQIASRLQHRKMPKTVRLDYRSLHVAEAELEEFKRKHHNKYEDWQLRILKSPHQSYSGEDDPILVVNEQGDVNPISAYSIMIDAISNKLEHVAFLSVDKFIAEDKPVMDFMKHIQKTTLLQSAS